MPVPAPEGWGFEVERTADKIILTVRLPDKLKKKSERLGIPYFFAEEGHVESAASQTYSDHSDGSFSITMKISEYAPKNSKQLRGVLAFDDSLVESRKGRSRWMRVVVPWEKGQIKLKNDGSCN